MTSKYTKALLAVAFLAVNAHAAVDLSIYRLLPIGGNVRFDPGEEMTYRFAYNSSSSVDVRIIEPIPAGARLVRWSDPRWSCSGEADRIVCTRRMEPESNQIIDLIIAAPDDPAGVVFTASARIETDEPGADATPYNNETPLVFKINHLLPVTTPDDFGAGALRDAIEHANAECTGTLPCKITFPAPLRIVPQSPLPTITACDVLIDGGGYLPDTRNRSFDVPRRVEISGESAGSGSGLVIASPCKAGFEGATVQGLAIHSFPENGISVVGAAGPQVTIAGCSLGTDATGTIAMPNGLRGISVAAPRVAMTIQNCLISGNTRSGIAFYYAGTANVAGNLIGVRFGAIPMPNGASGVYVDGGEVHLYLNAIEYNHDFGVAVGQNAAHVASNSDYIIANGGIAIDWGLDGPSDRAGLPPIPRLTEAFFDPAKGKTIVRGTLPLTILTQPGFYSVRVTSATGDYQGGMGLAGTGLFSTGKLGDIPFEIQIDGNHAGGRITAQSDYWPYADLFPFDTSEYSAAIVVQ